MDTLLQPRGANARFDQRSLRAIAGDPKQGIGMPIRNFAKCFNQQRNPFALIEHASAEDDLFANQFRRPGRRPAGGGNRINTVVNGAGGDPGKDRLMSASIRFETATTADA
jgi:hypothetical protein